MEQLYCYAEIIKAVTSQCGEWPVWRAHNGGAINQPQAWFWLDPTDKQPIRKIVSKWKIAQSPSKKLKLKL